MSITWYTFQEKLDAIVHADEFDVVQACEALEAFGRKASFKCILGLTIHKCLTSGASTEHTQRVVGRAFELITSRQTPMHFRANFLMTNGGLADPEVLERLYGNNGPLAVDIDTLNARSQRKLMINLNWSGNRHFNPDSMLFMVKHLWGWTDFEYSLREAIARAKNPEVVGALLSFEPLRVFCQDSTFDSAALTHPSVISTILRSGRFENGQQGKAIRAAIATQDRALVAGMAQAVCQQIQRLKSHHEIQSQVGVHQTLLKQYYPDPQGVEKDMVRLVSQHLEGVLVEPSPTL